MSKLALRGSNNGPIWGVLAVTEPVRKKSSRNVAPAASRNTAGDRNHGLRVRSGKTGRTAEGSRMGGAGRGEVRKTATAGTGTAAGSGAGVGECAGTRASGTRLAPFSWTPSKAFFVPVTDISPDTDW